MGNQEKIIFIAGFFDGEGCITIGKNGSISVGVVNTSINNLIFIKEVFSGTISLRKQKTNKTQYVYRLYGNKAVEFLLQIEKYLIDKKIQAISALEYYSKANLVQVIRLPNKRGAFSNPERQILLNKYRTLLTQQKAMDQL